MIKDRLRLIRPQQFDRESHFEDFIGTIQPLDGGWLLKHVTGQRLFVTVECIIWPAENILAEIDERHRAALPRKISRRPIVVAVDLKVAA